MTQCEGIYDTGWIVGLGCRGLAGASGDLGKIAAPGWDGGETHRFAIACGWHEVWAELRSLRQSGAFETVDVRICPKRLTTYYRLKV